MRRVYAGRTRVQVAVTMTNGYRHTCTCARQFLVYASPQAERSSCSLAVNVLVSSSSRASMVLCRF